jgi:hypothetical protein
MRVLLIGFLVASWSSIFAQREVMWTDTFQEDSASFVSRGTNPFFILEPGYQLRLKGKEGKKLVDLRITVLNETLMVDGVMTRVVEERESVNGKLVEVSRNYFATSTRTNGVYYFGEDVDIYKDGRIVGHEGAWRSGVDGAHYGLMMPGIPLLGARYYQEIAPGVAMDRAEVVGTNELIRTQAGSFERCLRVRETTPLESRAREYKCYARGIGLVQDAGVILVSYGFVTQ